jgi:hypothetical protein
MFLAVRSICTFSISIEMEISYFIVNFVADAYLKLNNYRPSHDASRKGLTTMSN